MICSTLSAIAFGLIYGFTEGLNVVYAEFGFSDRVTLLVFVPIMIGTFLSGMPRIYDTHHALRLRRQGLTISPEEKICSFAKSVPVFAIALWWFAWTIPP